jgi:hypothetical protein
LISGIEIAEPAALAELEAAEALRKLAEQAKLAGMSLEDFAIFKVKSLSNKCNLFLLSFSIINKAFSEKSTISKKNGIKEDINKIKKLIKY